MEPEKHHCGSRALGEHLAKTVAGALSGTPGRMMVCMASLNVGVVLACLGLFKLIPAPVMIADSVALSVLIAVLQSLAIDLHVAARIVLRDTFFLANIFFATLVGVGNACCLNWDYRGLCLIPLYIFSTITVSIVDACPFYVRIFAITLALNFAGTLVLNLVLLNLGVFPDQSPGATLYTIEGIGVFPIRISAYGVFNDATVALVLLNVNEIRLRWRNRARGTLRAVTVPIEGKDVDVDSGDWVDMSWMSRYVSVRRIQ